MQRAPLLSMHVQDVISPSNKRDISLVAVCVFLQFSFFCPLAVTSPFVLLFAKSLSWADLCPAAPSPFCFPAP